ncbi:MAG: glycoside hydrolase family 38 C-terminal domain-containing protein [Synechococcaceae cyanobacterium]|nr:glycoside hydrolase family 38 C-terminal domain-containing protein [Synechococcaceae cyanobacterium]
MPGAVEPDLPGGIEMFQSRSRLDLQPLWRRERPDGSLAPARNSPWAERHRPDWTARGLIVWPRGGRWCRLRLRLVRPAAWGQPAAEAVVARLVLRWWADRAELRVEGELVQEGDLFDTACRWALPRRWAEGLPLELDLRLRSPLHDDGALIHSRIEREPADAADPHGLLEETAGELEALRRACGRPPAPAGGGFHVLGHAHLDLAWLWPVADTWQAAERTFASVLELMERFPRLHFGHSTPALYAWLERHRPALHARVRAAMRAGRWEPLNGPWVETDCVLVGTASLLRQFQEGQRYSRRAHPEWEHALAWLPDSFGFAAGLPPVAAATGVRWFCTHKLAWNATNPFPHRLFRWRGRCGSEVLALMTAPIGSDGDPLAMERQRLDWRRVSGRDELLWLPGVGDHGGGPTAAMLEQLALWADHPAAAPQSHGTLRAHLARLEPLAAALPVWRDELYLELHRGCATTRPDQKRHNRTLERLLREAEIAAALAGGGGWEGDPPTDWRPLLFQQFHDILPGTSIPEVFEQAGPVWRAARRQAARLRERALGGGREHPAARRWRVAQLQPLPAAPRTVRLPEGIWRREPAAEVGRLPAQPAPGGGTWVQLPGIDGVGALTLRRLPPGAPGDPPAAAIAHPVRLERAEDLGPEHWRLGNGLLTAAIGPRGVEQLWDGEGRTTLAAPLAWRRWQDRGEYWDAWDLATAYRDHPLPWRWQGGPAWVERGPLCTRFLQRGRCGASRIRLDGCLRAGAPWLELVLRVDWRQRHELLRLEIPLAERAHRWAADMPGGVLERPALPRTPREQERWEVPVVSWLASVGERGGLAVLLDGPQGVSAGAGDLGVSLLRGPTWPDPGADNGCQRMRLALTPCPGGWRRAAVPLLATRFREPLWCRPLADTPPPPLLPFPPLGADLRLVGLRPAADGSGDGIATVQNEGPCRRRLRLGKGWSLVGRLDGLEEEPPPALAGEGVDGGDRDPLMLAPWQLGFWRLRPPRAGDARGWDQSS